MNRPPTIRIAAAAIALFAAVFCLFLPCVRNGFTNFDDPIYLLSNPHIQHGLGWQTIQWAFTTGYASNWHPLTWLSLALDWQWFGANPRGHHLENVALHAASAALLFIVLRKMTGATWRSLFVAAVFGMHPLRVESVAWATERNDVLCTLFWVLTLLAYVEWVQQSAGSKPGSRVFYALALGLFALGLMSKPMIVTLPFTLLLLDFWPLGRWPGPVKIKRLAIEKTPFFALALAECAVTWLVRQQGGPITAGGLSLGPGERIANACFSYTRYLGKLFAPLNLAVVYPLPPGGGWPVAPVIASAVYLLVITVAIILLARRWPYLLTGWFWYLGTLLPVIGLVQIGIQSMADRYTYVPMIGPVLALTWAACDAAGALRLPRFALPLFAAAALAGCAFLTQRQIAWWKDSETLFRHTIAVTRANPLAQLNLGCALAESGRVDEAISHFQLALQYAPDLTDADYNLGLALSDEGDFAGAAGQFRAAIALRPGDGGAHFHLGLALEKMHAWNGAAEQFQETAWLNPDFPDGHYQLGLMLVKLGRPDDAIAQFRETLRVAPGYARARKNLNDLLRLQGDGPDAE